FSPCQNASSRLTLVLCPAMTMERLTTGDFISRLPRRSDGDRGRRVPCWCARPPGRARLCCAHGAAGWPPHLVRPPCSALACAPLLLGSLARPAKIDDVAHVSASRSGTILHPCHVNSVANAPIPWRRRSD